MSSLDAVRSTLVVIDYLLWQELMLAGAMATRLGMDARRLQWRAYFNS